MINDENIKCRSGKPASRIVAGKESVKAGWHMLAMKCKSCLHYSGS
jgi:hypothetical protein